MDLLRLEEDFKSIRIIYILMLSNYNYINATIYHPDTIPYYQTK